LECVQIEMQRIDLHLTTRLNNQAHPIQVSAKQTWVQII
jgi:hypothetical protein